MIFREAEEVFIQCVKWVFIHMVVRPLLVAIFFPDKEHHLVGVFTSMSTISLHPKAQSGVWSNSLRAGGSFPAYPRCISECCLWLPRSVLVWQSPSLACSSFFRIGTPSSQ
jgi:hypothetical protein